MSEQETAQEVPQATFGPGGPEVWVMTNFGLNVAYKGIMHAVSGDRALVEGRDHRLNWERLDNIEVRRVMQRLDDDFGMAYAGRVSAS